MSLFENISFINEGEQADAYRKKKDNEYHKKRSEEFGHHEKRYGGFYSKDKEVGHRSANYNNPDKSLEKSIHDGIDDVDRSLYADDKLHTEIQRRKNDEGYVRTYSNRNDPIPGNYGNLYSKQSRDIAKDAINRHMRRHPDQYKESGIFESVSFINE